METDRHTAVSMAVIASILILAFLVIGGGAVATSVVLSLSAIRHEEAAAKALQQREMTAQLREGVPTCRAISDMDLASHVPGSEFPKPPRNGYDKRLSAAIHEIDTRSHCTLILSDLAKHESFAQIEKQLAPPTG